MSGDRILTLRVAAAQALTPEIRYLELVHPLGLPLPAYEPGAHIQIHLPGGFSRPYSLALAPEPMGVGVRRYVVGVKREPASRGGSASVHERVAQGDLLAVSAPRNTFTIAESAQHHLLLAGGIGLTPLLCMAQHLHARGLPFTLCVFAREPRQLAFEPQLKALGDKVRLHLDEPQSPHKIAMGPLLSDRAAGTHLYLCGPAGFMAAAQQAAAQWPEEAVHLEYFAPPASDADDGLDEPFTLRLARRAIDVSVAADQTAVEALKNWGIDVPTSCEQGICGTCVVRLAHGEAEHRDYCLTRADRRHKVALCCSRAKGGVLEIDL
jgi:vanillate O-demethylase ferredoxin subunit